MALRDPAGRTNRLKMDRQQDWALDLTLQLMPVPVPGLCQGTASSTGERGQNPEILAF